MKENSIALKRMVNQQIREPKFLQPAEVVKYMVAMQAQDYAGAKWAVGLRMQNSSDTIVEQAITDGKILRTHLLRPTWHFVSPEDIRWILALSAPRINAVNAGMYKKYELDNKVFSKSNDVFANTLQGNKQLTRSEIVTALQNSGIATDDLRLTLLLMHAELDAIICNGAKVGKQFTYALLDERAPVYPMLTHEEALTKLADGYFKTRGPATIHDFATWAGITVTDANTGLQNVGHQLINEIIEGKTYWMSYNAEHTNDKKTTACLLPAFDEFAIAYKDRDAIVNPKYLQQAKRVIFDPSIIVDNQVVGTWKRTVRTNKVDISLNLFGKPNIAQTKAVEQAVNRYKKYMD